MYPNPLKQRLQRGEVLLGTGACEASPYIVGPILDTKPDFLWFDTEHMPYGTEALTMLPVLCRMRGVARRLTQAHQSPKVLCRMRGVAPMIRVAWNDPALIKKAYDAGAVAVMVPQVDTAEEAARAVQYARYPPEGRRGLSPMWTRIAGVDWNEAIKTANQETVLILQLESQEAFDNLEEIKQVKGFDVLLVGPLDLSASVGTITDTKSHRVREIMREVPRRLEGSDIVAGTTLVEVSDIQEVIRWGYRYVNVGNAMGYGVQVVKQNLESLRRTFGKSVD